MHPLSPCRIRLFVAFATSLLLTGCFQPSLLAVRSADVTFNSKLRLDMAPTTSLGPATHFTDGHSGDQIVSPLTFSSIPALHQDQLRMARTFWVEREGYVRVSYETVLRNLQVDVDPDEPENVQTYTVESVGLCEGPNGTPRDPVTRGALVITPNPPEDWAISPYRPEGTVTLKACNDGALKNDPTSPPVPFDRGCTETDMKTNTTAEIANPNPFCLINAQVAQISGDVSLSLRARANNLMPLPENFTEIPQTLPNVRTVAASRKLARPLTYIGMRPTAEGQERHRFEWQVGVEDNVWNENFSPNLQVSKALIYIKGAADPQTGFPNRTYLAPAPLTAFMRPSQYENTLVIKVGECKSEDQHVDDGSPAYLDIPACIGRVTPTYANAQLDAATTDVRMNDEQRLVWTYDVLGTPSFDPAMTPLYVEFEVSNAAFDGRALLADVGARNFGNVPAGQTSRFTGTLRIFNVGGTSARLTQLSVSGPSAPQFRVQPASGTLPAFVPGYGFTDLTIEVTPAVQGPMTATLEIQGGSVGGTAQTVRVSLAANAQAGDLMVEPRTLVFVRNIGGAAAEHPAARPFLISNPGNAPLTRSTFQISGPGQSEFSIVQVRQGQSITSPPSISRLLNPGESEVVYVLYHPNSVGIHQAALSVNSTAGVAVMALHGTCNGGCTDVPPILLSDAPNMRIAIREAARVTTDQKLKTTIQALSPNAAVVLFNLGRKDIPPASHAADNGWTLLLTPANKTNLTNLGLIEQRRPARNPPAYQLSSVGMKVHDALVKVRYKPKGNAR